MLLCLPQCRVPHQSLISEQLGQAEGTTAHSSTLPFHLPFYLQCHPGLPGQLWAGRVPGPWSRGDMGASGWNVLPLFPLG